MLDVEVIEEPAVAVTALDPVRARILAALSEPGSATSVAELLGEPRQKINYHLRILEDHGLVRLVEERQRRGLTERIMIASARSYVVASEAFGDSATEPERVGRWSSRYLVAVAARMLREVADLARRADDAHQSLATLAIDTEIRFSSAQDRAAFTQELSSSVADLVSRYHDESAPDGRWHRLVVAAHPHPTHPQNEKD